ncbi:hypothetical protein [Myxococcus eversor]|uniref:hypothetical protein n=1 Tax=Myxococcus eversor TaxID=2709661 RepID=UPI0013D38996|nr:hypothetical protein [Myxococcus eversor]
MDAKRLEALSRQPLHVAALGWAGSECLTARANYVRLEVRDEAGQLRLEHDTWRKDGRILRDMRFAGAHLVASIGDIFADGLRIWDVQSSVETSRVGPSWHVESSGVLWSDPVQPRALVRNRAGVAILDATTFDLTRTARCAVDGGPIAYDALHDVLAVGDGFDPTQLTLRDFDGHFLRTLLLEGSEVDDLRFSGDGRFLAVQ